MSEFNESYPSALKLPQPGVVFERSIFLIPWGHNKLIIIVRNYSVPTRREGICET